MRHLLYFLVIRVFGSFPPVRQWMHRPRSFKVWGGPIRGKSLEMAPIHGFTKILGRYEPEVADFMNRTIRLGDHCVDGGCHVGYFTLLMAKKVGPKGAVLAVDPSPVVRDLMAGTHQANPHDPITFSHSGLGDKPGLLPIGNEGDVNMVNLDRAKGGQKVRIHTLDSLVTQLKWKRLDFIKLDVEGFEGRVLQGARVALKKFRPTLLVEIHNPFDRTLGEKVGAFLENLNYKLSDLNGVKLNRAERARRETAGDTFYMVAIPNTPPKKVPAKSRVKRKTKRF